MAVADASLAPLPEAADVVVIGGGVTGAGVALDAAARGLSVVLLERADWASGTSSQSSKLVHGGLRYLQQKELALVRENLAERQRLLDNAPHLVSLLPFLIPVFRRGGMAGAATDLAVTGGLATVLRLYDSSGGSRIGRSFEHLSAEELGGRLAGVTDRPTAGGFVYYDCQADDARLVLTLVRSAVAHGAAVANRTPVAGLSSRAGRVDGVILADGRRVAARCVVNAAGVWSGAFLAPAGAGEPSHHLTPAKGVHLSFPARLLAVDDAVVLPVPADKRSLFIVPGTAIGCPSVTYVGTTDTPYDGPLDRPRCDAADAAYVLDALNHWRPPGAARLTVGDISATWAGLRPLLADARSERTADLSRRHAVATSVPGLVSVLGGKLTTYRAMAEDAVDAVCTVLGEPRPCPTAGLLLDGAAGHRGVAAELAPELGEAVAHHLVSRHGTRAREVADLVRSDPGLARPLVEGLPALQAEAVYAARSEMAHHLDDVLVRRTRSLLADRDATEAAMVPTAALLAAELGWDRARTASEIDALQAVIDDERASLR